MGRPVRLANDANCFALSEAVDGAGAGARSVFGVILGTGCGGGLVFDGRLIDGPRGIGGEWGHNPLPWTTDRRASGPRVLVRPQWLHGNMGLRARPGGAITRGSRGRGFAAEEIAAAPAPATRPPEPRWIATPAGSPAGSPHVVNIFDPDVIVLGGGLSQARPPLRLLPGLMAPYIFAERAQVIVKPPRWGDASGVRGAAWLWGRDVTGRGISRAGTQGDRFRVRRSGSRMIAMRLAG